jgi:hypothetical protein
MELRPLLADGAGSGILVNRRLLYSKPRDNKGQALGNPASCRRLLRPRN